MLVALGCSSCPDKEWCVLNHVSYHDIFANILGKDDGVLTTQMTIGFCTYPVKR
ncbi:hypothetical protein VULLAG_LOCUS17718 [Vulpes lagopus]